MRSRRRAPSRIKNRMALPQSKAAILPLAEERRRFQRVRVNLLGRYMLADRREFPCQVTDMSPGGMALIAPVSGQVGERVIAYVDHVGRLEGVIARQFQNGFAMTVAATTRKRDKLAAQLTWLANRHILNLPEDRRHGRVHAAQPGGAPDPAERHQYRRAASSTCRPRAPRSRPSSGPRSAPWSPSARPPAGWCATSKTASRSSSPACSTPTLSKRTSPAGKRRAASPARRSAISRALRRPSPTAHRRHRAVRAWLTAAPAHRGASRRMQRARG